MKVRYTRRALRQLTEILAFIDARSPQGADNVKRRLQAVINLLTDHPNSGRLTDKNGISRASSGKSLESLRHSGARLFGASYDVQLHIGESMRPHALPWNGFRARASHVPE